MGILEINNLRCRQGDFLLSIDTLNLSSGYIHGLVGKNGAGKTTFLRCIMKLNTFNGDIRILGASINKSDQSFLQNIGYVNDKNYFNGELTINQLASFMRPIYTNWDDSLFQHLLDQYNLTEHCNKKVAHLSKGMGVKLAMATAISHHPLLYVLDEPTSGLDPIVRIEVLNSLKQYADEDKASVVFSSHILEDIEDIADFLMIINNGRNRIVLSKFILEIITAIGSYIIIIGANSILMLFGKGNPIFDLYSLIFNIGLILIHTSCAMIIFLKSGFSSIRYASIPLFAVIALSVYISRSSPVSVFSIYQVTVGVLGLIIIISCFLYSVYLLKSRRYLQS